MLLDSARLRITVRADLAADFNSTLAQGLRTAVTSAPTGADVALMAALAALIPVAGDWGRHTPRPGWKERFDEY